MDEVGDVRLRAELLQGAVLVQGTVREALGVVAVLPGRGLRDPKETPPPRLRGSGLLRSAAEAPRKAVLAERGLCEEVVGPRVGPWPVDVDRHLTGSNPKTAKDARRSKACLWARRRQVAPLLHTPSGSAPTRSACSSAQKTEVPSPRP